MFVDALCLLSDAQSYPTGATTIATGKYDLGAVTPRRDPGAGEMLVIVVTIDTSLATTGDTIDFDVISDEDATMATPTIHGTYRYTVPQLPAGSIIALPIPMNGGGKNYERYLGLQGTVSSGGSCTLTASIMRQRDVPAMAIYHSAIVID